VKPTKGLSEGIREINPRVGRPSLTSVFHPKLLNTVGPNPKYLATSILVTYGSLLTTPFHGAQNEVYKIKKK